MNVLSMTDLDIKEKRVLIREDLNVPIKNGQITSDARLVAALPTLRHAIAQGARVMVLSHLGRPEEGIMTPEDSLAPVAERLSSLLGTPVSFVSDYLDGLDVAPGQIVLCENVRYNVGEKKNNESLGKKYAALCDVFVMDAFATAHRAQASTHAVAKFAPVACAGPLLTQELQALETAALNPKKPTVAVIGGSKVSTKLTVLDSLCKQVDTLIVGGGIANNFLKAQGAEVGISLFEPDLVAEAARLSGLHATGGAIIPVPVDVVTAPEFSPTSPATVKMVSEVEPQDMILDIGPETAANYAKILSSAATIIWNGPVGAFEINQFGRGTEAIAKAIAASPAYSLAGGGDTLAAVDKYGVRNRISYLSTGGGAFLEFLEGKRLPAVEILEERAANN